MTQKQTENSLGLGRITLPTIGPIRLSVHLTVPLALLFICYDFGISVSNTIAFSLVFLLAVGIHEGAHLLAEQLFSLSKQGTSAGGLHTLGGALYLGPFSAPHTTPSPVQNQLTLSSAPVSPATASLTVIGIWWSKPWNFRWTYLTGPLANLLAAGYILATYASDGVTPREWEALLMPQTIAGQLFLTNAWLGIMNFISSPPADLGFALSHYYRPIDKNSSESSNAHIRLAQWILFPILILALLAGKLGLVIGTGYLLFNTFRASVWNACVYNDQHSPIAKYVTPAADLRSFRRTDSIDGTLEVLMTAHQDYFPVVAGGTHETESVIACGIIERNAILSALAQGEGHSPVTTLIDDTIRTVSADETVTSLFYEFHPVEESVCMVQQNGTYTGLVFPNKIAHIVWIKSIKELVEL